MVVYRKVQRAAANPHTIPVRHPPHSDFIERHNNDGQPRYTLAHNRFSHLTFDEFRAQVRTTSISQSINDEADRRNRVVLLLLLS